MRSCWAPCCSSLFVWTQHRSSHPTIDVALFRNRHFSSGAAAIAAAFFALQGSTFYLAYYFQAVRGYSPLLAGTALIGVAAAVMTAAPLSARLSGRFGPRNVVAFGMALVAIGLAFVLLRHAAHVGAGGSRSGWWHSASAWG